MENAPEPLANRLGESLSPYLLQHAHNPVAWQPWDDRAWALARRLDRPVLLSIGYATCHWCHVMAHESFEDEAVAEAINRVFVPIKVDREERPDVDAIYMEALQATAGRGGWPLTALLTPDARPFYLATYLPPRAQHGRPGVVELAQAVGEAWRHRRDELTGHAARLTLALNAPLPSAAPGTLPPPGPDTLDRAFDQLRQRFDAERGGWGAAPKFPTPHVGRFGLRYAARTGRAEARAMVEKTLHAMRRGGLFDQLGGGFHRYSTDATWTLPHFEKMLYDQAGLLLLYAEAWAATGEARFARTARETVAYLDRNLTGPEGAFFAAEDADSEGREGAFYVWTMAEIEETLGADDARRFARAYSVAREGNFADESTGRRTGENVLHEAAGLDDAQRDALAPARAALFARRETRPRPLLDDKILTDWNGLMVAALARAGTLLADASLVARACRAMDWLLENMTTPEGRLLHRARHGHVGLDALADDYAFTVWALVELHQATQQARWLAEAFKLQAHFDAHFWDDEAGAYALQPDDGEALIARTVARYDGAAPSANSVAAHNLVRLAKLGGRPDLRRRALALLASSAAELHAAPSGHAHLLLALDETVHDAPEVVLAAAPGADVAPFVEAFRAARRPGALVVTLDGAGQALLAPFAPGLAAFALPAEGVQAYVCQNLTCEAPVGSAADLAARL